MPAETPPDGDLRERLEARVERWFNLPDDLAPNDEMSRQVVDVVMAEVSPVLERLRGELAEVHKLLPVSRHPSDDYRNALANAVTALAEQRQRAEQAEAELARIRKAVIDVYGEDYGGEDVATEVERLLRHLSDHEDNLQRILQRKNEAIERAEAGRDALKAAIERVRAVADEWGEPHHCRWLSASVLVRQLRAALGGDAAAAGPIANAERARRAEAEVERLRAGEADSPGDPDTWPTPAEWIRRWNDATPEQRLAIAQAYVDLSRAAWSRHRVALR